MRDLLRGCGAHFGSRLWAKAAAEPSGKFGVAGLAAKVVARRGQRLFGQSRTRCRIASQMHNRCGKFAGVAGASHRAGSNVLYALQSHRGRHHRFAARSR